MVRVKIEPCPALEELIQRFGMLSKKSMPLVANAMQQGASALRDTWIAFASGGKLDGVTPLNKPNTEYARSIRIDTLSPFDYEIYSDADIAKKIEDGSPKEVDMRETHLKGPRSRISAAGYAYLIVPFRWGTKDDKKQVGFKNVMPAKVYNIVKNFKRMETLVDAKSPNATKTKNAQGNMVGRAIYNTGYGRLNNSAFAGTIQQKLRMSGMVRADADDSGKSSSVSSAYFTFRVISANPKARSDNWIRKAIPARPVREKVVEHCEPKINAMIEEAAKGDLASL